MALACVTMRSSVYPCAWIRLLKSAEVIEGIYTHRDLLDPVWVLERSAADVGFALSGQNYTQPQNTSPQCKVCPEAWTAAIAITYTAGGVPARGPHRHQPLSLTLLVTYY